MIYQATNLRNFIIKLIWISVLSLAIANCALAAVYLNAPNHWTSTKDLWRLFRIDSGITTTMPYHETKLQFMQGLFSHKHIQEGEVVCTWMESNFLLRGLEDLQFGIGFGMRHRIVSPIVQINSITSKYRTFRFIEHATVGHYFGYNLCNPIRVFKDTELLNHHLLYSFVYNYSRVSCQFQLYGMPEFLQGTDDNNEMRCSSIFRHTFIGNATFRISYPQRADDDKNIKYLIPRYTFTRGAAFQLSYHLGSRAVVRYSAYSHAGRTRDFQFQSAGDNIVTELIMQHHSIIYEGAAWEFEYALTANASLVLSYLEDEFAGNRPSISVQWKSDGNHFKLNKGHNVLRRPIEHHISPSVTRYIDREHDTFRKELLHFVNTRRTLQEEKLAQTFSEYTNDQRIQLETAKIWLLMSKKQRSYANTAYCLPLLPTEIRIPINTYVFAKETIENEYIKDLFGSSTEAEGFTHFGAAPKMTLKHVTVLWDYLDSLSNSTSRKEFLNMKRVKFKSVYNQSF